MKYLLFILLTTSLAFCSTPSKTTEQATNDTLKLANTYWQLESFQPAGQKMTAALNDEATLFFDGAGSIGGNTGCNTIGGDYKLSGNQLTIQAFGTKMYCDAVAAMESTINDVMSAAMTAKIEAGKLILSRSGGQLVYKPTKKPSADMGSSAAPQQYDQQPAATTEVANKAAAPAADATKAVSTTNTITGLFRYMADSANFQRCSDGKRFAVSMEAAFKDAETVYLRMEKHGAASLMTFEADIVKNPGEGHDEAIIIRKVVSSSYDSSCN